MGGAVLRSIQRQFTHHKLYTALNLVGLGFGIAVFLTMALIVRYEFSYDAYVPDAAHVFQLDGDYRPAGHEPMVSDAVSFVPYPFLKQDFPAITHAVRVLSLPTPVRVGSQLGREDVQMTDPDFFAVFPLTIIDGRAENALDGPAKVVLSASMARKYFGTDHAVGRTMHINNAHDPATVSAVFADPPPNSTMSFNILTPFPSAMLGGLPFQNWGSTWGTMWIRVGDLSTLPAMRHGLLTGYPARHPGTMMTPAQINAMFGSGGLMPVALPDVHFHNAEIGDGGTSPQLIDILGLVGVAALATAVVNYINLATSRVGLRAREVAIRKVMGASRRALIVQFMGEACALVSMATLVGLALTELGLRWVNTLGGWDVRFDWAFVLPMAIVITIGVGMAAGLYPALVLSAFRPAAILAASRSPSGGRMASLVRTALVVGQFAFAITLAICTLVMSHQAAFIRTLDRGLHQDGLIVIDSLSDDSLMNRQAEIVRRLGETPGVTIATRSDMFSHHTFDRDDWHRAETRADVNVAWGYATPVYFEALSAKLLAGRLFDTAHGADYHDNARQGGNGTSVVISRLAAERFGFATPRDAIGQSVMESRSAQVYRVIGVIDDIRFGGAHEPLQPLLYMGKQAPLNYVGALVRYSGVSTQQEMARLRSAWEQIAPDVPFSATSANDIFADDYRADADRGALFGIGAGIAIMIACLGLYGLSTFNISQRMQEIGIRKVLGAGTRDILALLTGRFLRPVLIANVIAWPVAWVLMRGWLSGFDQRVTLTPLPFAIVAIGALFIALSTIISQATRAARQPPVVALRQN
ncbi:ABC transporter permease [Brytella acorum]|nr:ABC transporter permease [Brytella acorum]MDF3624720.1 ABC transporter permease [Brytella acorum]